MSWNECNALQIIRQDAATCDSRKRISVVHVSNDFFHLGAYMRSATRAKMFSFLIIPIALTSCVSYYKPTGAKNSTADLVMVRGAEHLGSGSLQEYEAYKDASCMPSAKFGRLAALLTYGALEKEAKIDTRGPVHILARLSIYGQGPIRREGHNELAVEVTRNSCSNFFSFIPMPNRRYRVKQELDRDTCVVSVVDDDGEAQPVETVELDPSVCPIPKL
jgi:hypothetical protein